MAEQYYTVPENPVYDDTQIRKIQDTDPVRASTIVNPVLEKLIENTAAVRKKESAHTADADIHVTAAQKNTWDGKAPGSLATTVSNHTSDATVHVTAAQKNTWDGKAPGSLSTTVSNHTGNGDIHVAAADKTKWNGYQTIHTLGYSKSGTVHQLTGLSGLSGTLSCVFKATAAFAAGDTFTVDGVAYAVQLSNGEAAEANLFVSGATVPVVVDTAGKKVNFKAGGGLSNSKLALATAMAADVRSGKTFYSGNKTLKTGAMAAPYKMKTGTVYVTNPTHSDNIYVECGIRCNYIMTWYRSDTGYLAVCAYIDGEGYSLATAPPIAALDPDKSTIRSMPSGSSIGPLNNGFVIKSSYYLVTANKSDTLHYAAFGEL